MTLQQIYYVILVADIGSMNKAAENLFISQPTLTTAIKELENEIGIIIFNRTNRGVTLTREGNEFLMHARQVYQQYELLKDKYGPQGNIKKKFSVSCQHYSFATKAFVETVKQFDTLKYEFAIKESKTIDVINDVGNSKSEIGILYMSEYKHHPLANRESIGLEELQDYPYLSFDQGEDGAFYLAEEILSENEYQRVIKLTDRSTALNLMIGLNGYMLCSGIICEELNGDDCIVIPYKADEDNPNSSMTIGYIYKKHSVLSKIGQTYVDELKEYFD